MSEMPGPLVAVMARAPAHPAPITMPSAASSSSACTMAKVARPSGPMRCLRQAAMSDSVSEEDGVMGYQATTVAPANMAPRAAAELPSMTIFPRLASIRSTRSGSFLAREPACSWPARAAATLSSAAFFLLPNCFWMARSTSAISMPRSRATTPT
jgi:hypothetical protein